MAPLPDLPESAKTWALKVGGETCTYGDIHEIMHRDISTGNDFRKERIKLLITLATGVFALMVTFHKDLFASQETHGALAALLAGFALLLVSVLVGIWHFRSWEDFYLAHRGLSTGVWGYHTATDDAKRSEAATIFSDARTKINAAQASYRCYDFAQTYTLIFGLIFILVYVGIEAYHFPFAAAAPCKERSSLAGTARVAAL